MACVHGDSHHFRLDKLFLSASGERLDNFTRVKTFGKSAANGHNDVHWLEVTVDVRSRDAFSYEPMMVPGKSNRCSFAFEIKPNGSCRR